MAKNNNLDRYVDLGIDLDQWGVEQAIEQFKPFVPALEDVSKDLPWVKSIIAVLILPRTLQDIAFGVKINDFLYNSDIDQSKVEKLKKKLGKKRNSRLWERIVLSINNHDDKLKSAAVGMLAKALIDELITYDEFFDMVHVTNNLNMNTLDVLKTIYSLDGSASLQSGRHYDFMGMGLISNNRVAGMSWGGTGGYSINQFGWRYVGIILDNPESSVEGHPIGKGVLVDTYTSDDAWQLQGVYPVEYVLNQKLPHDEVDIFMINDTTEVLCDESTGLPLAIERGFVEAGEDGRSAAKRIVGERFTVVKMMLLRRMEDVPVRKNMFVVLGNEQQPSTIFRTPQDILVTISENKKTDETRYIVEAVNQIKRIESGELKLVDIH
ncbi:hypothetical protein D3C73_15790 [compost metagenome]